MTMPESRIDEQIAMFDTVKKGDVATIRVPIDPTYLAACQDQTVEVVSIVCNSAAVTGGWVEGDVVVVEVSPLARDVTKTVVRLSGMERGKTQRYRGPTDAELAWIETTLAGAQGTLDFNY